MTETPKCPYCEIKQQSEWISVKDRLPDVDTCPEKFYERAHVNVYNGEYVLPAIYERINYPEQKLKYRWKYCWGRTYDGPPITHWMPLPEPPKEAHP